MSKKGKHHSFVYYLNPLVWVKMLFSCLLTFFLFLNHFYVPILICVIVVLAILFSYDRYATATYDKDADASEYMEGVFSSREAYSSPLARGDKYLLRDLARFFGSADERK